MTSDPISLSSTDPFPAAVPFVSVIIPVYNDIHRLKTCLAALEHQTYPSHRYEIIVIDNGSEDALDLATLGDQPSHTVLLHEPTPGSYIARNRGLTVAKGDIIAFTDADCIPAADWLEKGVQHLQDSPQCGLVAGRIEMFVDDPTRITPAALYDQVILGFPQQEFLEYRQAGMTANVFTRRSVVQEVGSFRADLKSHGDLEWGARVYAAGYGQRYADDAKVSHPTRDSIQSLWTRNLRLTGGAYGFYMAGLTPWKRHKRLVKMILDDLFIYNLKDSRKTLSDPRLAPWPTRLRVLGIVWFMRGVSALEKIRLHLGGRPHR